MISPVFDDYVTYARQHFEEGLIRAGFVENAGGWQGTVKRISGTTYVRITLDSRFPFHPPRVVPVDPEAVAWSWHRERDGALCLISEDDHEGLWWANPGALLEHVEEWFRQLDMGWPDDRPDLDLDRYFDPSEDRRLYVYDDLTKHRNSFVRFRTSTNNTMMIGPGTRPVKTSKYGKDSYGYVADLGDVAMPPSSWDDIAAKIDTDVNIDRKIRDYSVSVVVLTYRRGGHDGAIALEVRPMATDYIAVRRLTSVADTEAARSARAGVIAPELSESRLAIVGVGALGSFIADTAVRSGIRHLTLIDADLITPGNLVRHLVGPEMVGLSKVTAVTRHLVSRNEISASSVHPVEGTISNGEEAAALLSSHDLVVNATADFSTTALLHLVADSLGTRILTVALQNDGANLRIDVLPPLDGADVQPPTSVAIGSRPRQVFEAGCGSPVSPSPPVAVIEAAATAVRHAIGLLVGRPLQPAGELRNLPVSSESGQP